MEQSARQMDNSAAKGYGMVAGVMTYVASNALALTLEAALIQVIIALVSGVFSWLASVSVALIKEAFRERREKRSLKGPAESDSPRK